MKLPKTYGRNLPGRDINNRQAFTIMEVMVALGLLSIAIVLLAQIALGEIVERKRQQSRQEILETAANILESARSLPFESLTPEWATAQRLPEPLAARLLDGRLKVTVKPFSALPKLKQVVVDISWQHESNIAARPVVLTGFFGARMAPQSGDKP